MSDLDAKNHSEQCWRECERLCQTLESIGGSPMAVGIIRAAVKSALSTTPAKLTARSGVTNNAGGAARDT